MPHILDDDDEEDVNVGSAPSGLEVDKAGGEVVCGVSLPQDSASESAASGSDDETDDRPSTLADSEGGCLGKGFNPYIMPVDTLVKKLERRKAGWQKKQLNIDAAIERAMYPAGSFMDHDAVIVEDDGDDAREDAPCGSPDESPSGDEATFDADRQVECPSELKSLSHSAHVPRHKDLPSTEPTSDKPFDWQQSMGAWGRDKLSAAVSIADPHAAETLKGACDAEAQLMVRDDRLQSSNCHLIQQSVQHDTDILADSLCSPDDPKPVEDIDCAAHVGVDQHVDPGNCKQISEEEEEEASQLGSEPSCQGSEPDEDPRRPEEQMQGLEDSDVESLQGDVVDEDDEEAMLEAAIMQERRAQRLLTAKRPRGNQFCDGEAEQSEDEAVSSDESDADDENGALSVEEIADMMRELREKGLGEAEVATAHAQWLADEDDKALKTLLHGIKKGFGKGRKRVVTDAEDWDVDEARERRRALLPHFENRSNVHQTEDDVLSQYKRKLAALERSLESPVKPVAKSMHRRERAPASCAVVENVVLPEIDDTDESPRRHRDRPWAQLLNSQAAEPPSTLFFRPDSQSWDTGSILGPSLMGKNRKGSNSVSMMSNSRNFVACTLGATSSRAASSTAVGPAVSAPSASVSACQGGSQATFTKIREALGIQECGR